jgi:hypothetical protein
MTRRSYYPQDVRWREAIDGRMRQNVSCVMNFTDKYFRHFVEQARRGKHKQKLRRIIALDEHALRNVTPALSPKKSSSIANKRIPA